MLQEGIVYSQVPQNDHTKIQIEKGEQYYKRKYQALKEKLFQFEKENEQLILENQCLLDQNLQYNDTISQISRSTLDQSKQNISKKIEMDYQQLIKHTKRLNQDMKKMVEKVKKAEEIILNLKRTGNPSIQDLINTLDQKTQKIYELEDKVSQLTQSENFTKQNLFDETKTKLQFFEENNELKQLLDSLKSHYQQTIDEKNLIIKQQRSEINEIHSKNLLLENCARNSQKMNQKAVEDAVENKFNLNKKILENEQKTLELDQIKKNYIDYQIKNPSCQPVEIKRLRKFQLY